MGFLLLAGEGFATGIGDQARDHVGVHVGIGPTVLDVAPLVEGHLPRNPDRSTTI